MPEDAKKTPSAGTPAKTPGGDGSKTTDTPPEDSTGTDQEKGKTGNVGGEKQTAPPDADLETFFDPKAVSPELMPAYKQMQAAFTRKTQDLARGRKKMDAYDAFMANPVEQLQAMAAQYGLSIVKSVEKPQDAKTPEGQWEPQSWDEVFSRFETQVMEKINAQLKPVYQNVQRMTANNIEAQLDSIDPNWRLYEDDMMANLKAHPTLVGEITKLYRMSVPEGVIEARTVKAALKKLEDKAKAAQIHGGEGTPKTAVLPKRAASFNEAVAQAKEQLGIT